MGIHSITETHARQCRKALKEMRIRPAYDGPSLEGADLKGANLQEADLEGANLEGANLRGANLQGANLQGADLWEVNLRGANLQGANLRDVDLREVNLRGVNLQGATLPDGRTLEQWQADPLAGLCTEPEAVRRATAAWGAKSWENCPMHAAHGWGDWAHAPAEKQLLLAIFVALHDGDHLPKPPLTEDQKNERGEKSDTPP